MIQLTPEQTAEALRHPDGVSCRGVGTDRTFVLVEAVQEKDVHQAIADGVADLDAGRTMSVEEARRRLAERRAPGGPS